MKVRILAFGILKEMIGSPVAEIEIPDGSSAQMLKEELQKCFPALQQLSSCMIALNGNYASGMEVIQPGDEVALIPPVSGG